MSHGCSSKCGFAIESNAYLAGDDKRAKEDSLVGPLLERDVEMGFGPVEVDEGGQDGGYFYFCADEDVADHGRE